MLNVLCLGRRAECMDIISYSSGNTEPGAGFFEEEGLIFNLSWKRESLRKYRDYSLAFENDEKTEGDGLIKG